MGIVEAPETCTFNLHSFYLWRYNHSQSSKFNVFFRYHLLFPYSCLHCYHKTQVRMSMKSMHNRNPLHTSHQHLSSHSNSHITCMVGGGRIETSGTCAFNIHSIYLSIHIRLVFAMSIKILLPQTVQSMNHSPIFSNVVVVVVTSLESSRSTVSHNVHVALYFIKKEVVFSGCSLT